VSFLFPARENLRLLLSERSCQRSIGFQQYRNEWSIRLSAKGVHPSRTVLFPNWVDTERFPLEGPNPFRKELGIQESTVVALYSGSMARKHGLELLVDAASRFEALSRLTIYFLRSWTLRQMLADKAKDLSNVTLLPVQPAGRLNDLLNLADIISYPS